jgi:hypothetical protein
MTRRQIFLLVAVIHFVCWYSAMRFNAHFAILLSSFEPIPCHLQVLFPISVMIAFVLNPLSLVVPSFHPLSLPVALVASGVWASVVTTMWARRSSRNQSKVISQTK